VPVGTSTPIPFVVAAAITSGSAGSHVQMTPEPIAAPRVARFFSVLTVGPTVCPANPVATAACSGIESQSSVRPAPTVPVVVRRLIATVTAVAVVFHRPISTILARTAAVAYRLTFGSAEVPRDRRSAADRKSRHRFPYRIGAIVRLGITAAVVAGPSFAVVETAMLS
jgi:hypothetical protein